MAKLAPACPARPCGLRRHDAALAPGDMSPRPSPARPQSNQIRPRASPPGPLFAWRFPRSPKPGIRAQIPPIKAKNPAIVPHQGISRHPMKKHKMAMPHQSGWNRRNAGTVSPSPGGEGRGEGGQQNKLASVRRCMGLSPETRFPSQTRLIKANEASSMQTMKFSNGEVGRVTPCAPLWRTQTPTLAGIVPVNPGFLVGRRRRAEDCPPYRPFPLCDFATPRLCVKTPSSRQYQGSIKAKTPAIKANRASSRQTPKNESPLFGQSTRWMGRTGIRQVKTCTKENSSPGGEDTGEGERHHQSVPFCASRRQSRQKPL